MSGNSVNTTFHNPFSIEQWTQKISETAEKMKPVVEDLQQQVDTYQKAHPYTPPKKPTPWYESAGKNVLSGAHAFAVDLPVSHAETVGTHLYEGGKTYFNGWEQIADGNVTSGIKQFFKAGWNVTGDLIADTSLNLVDQSVSGVRQTLGLERPFKDLKLNEPRLIAEEQDVTPRSSHKINDAYDLKLYQLADGNYQLEISMKIQFFFKEADAGPWLKQKATPSSSSLQLTHMKENLSELWPTRQSLWTKEEKQEFMQGWQDLIKEHWGKPSIYLKNGKKLSFKYHFETQEAGWMADHWEIDVYKVKEGQDFDHQVWPSEGIMKLDSKSLAERTEFGIQQKAAPHEFGHMLGLHEDEYNKKSLYYDDAHSIMNSGHEIRPRHLTPFKKWAEEKLMISSF